MNKNFSYIKPHRYLVNEKATILEAMKVIEQGEERVCFIIDEHEKLIKVISDGDIRRSLLQNLDLKKKVIEIHNNDPKVIHEEQIYEQVEKVLNKNNLIAPVVNKQGKIVGVLRYKDVIPQIDIRSYKVTIIGLGYVGLTLGLVMADQGFSIYGLDKDKKLIAQLKNKEAPFHEKGIEHYINKHVNKSLKIGSDEEIINSDIYIITVGTPINNISKKPEVKNILEAASIIGKKLKKNDLVVLRSTVPIGCTRKIVIPKLEEVSKLSTGKDFSVAFCPERTAEGRALEELKNLPQIVGGFDKKSRELGMRLFSENTHTVIDIGSLEAAEMCKLMDNTYRDTRFAFANQMAELSEKYGLNINHLINKVNLSYERNTIPFPSPGVGGACLSKDPYILINNFEENNLDCSLTRASRKINEEAPINIFNKTKKFMDSVGKEITKAKIFIIGLAFKGEPETSDLRDSTTVWFINKLKENGVFNLWGFDPIVEEGDIEKLNIIPCTLEEGFNGADAVFIMNNHKSYLSINLSLLLEKMNKSSYFFDGWNIFDANDFVSFPGITYSGIGLK
ncbi:MAG: hypothetical protein CMM49_05430 [Rhodospirillaceae bacterium]|nr:hypothetical protein [Rhodospirillaceae bacterium]